MSPEPSWPSLYNPFIEIIPFIHRPPVLPGGRYLYAANDIFRYTLYWTLFLYVPAFLVCGIYAFFNLTFPPDRAHLPRRRRRPGSTFSFLSWAERGHQIPLQPYSNVSTGPNENMPLQYRSRAKQNEGRSRLTFALLVFIAFGLIAVAGAVIGSALIGYVLAGLFLAGKYNMSTWIPFTGALLQTLVGFLGIWPEVVDII